VSELTPCLFGSYHPRVEALREDLVATAGFAQGLEQRTQNHTQQFHTLAVFRKQHIDGAAYALGQNYDTVAHSTDAVYCSTLVTSTLGC
jgi:hypothetical protein